jgi:YDG domain-containing protein/Big-like domain-containing protein
VGTGKAVSVSGISISGTDAGNYSLSNTTTATNANITPKHISGSFTADDRVYDGGTSATVLTRSLNGAIGGDVVGLNGGTAAFADKNVGTGKTVTLTGASLSGTDSGNYMLDSVATTTATIMARTLHASATGIDKIYDATNAATVTLTDDRVAGDAVIDSYTSATFSDKNVGTGKTVTVSGISISGSDAGNYSLSNPTAATTANITPKPASVTPAAAGKTYGSQDPSPLTTGTLSGFVAADVITASYSRTAGETVAGSPYTISAALSPATALGNYIITYYTAYFTISKASTTGSLSITPGVNNGPGSYILNTSQTFSVTVTPQFTGTPTGTVTLNDGNTTIATITLSGGLGSIKNSTLVSAILGAHNLSAVYNGDGNFNTSTSFPNSFSVGYAIGGTCDGDYGHQILQPINAAGTMSVFKLGSTVPTKFRVCDANGVSIGTPGVVTGYGLVAAAISPSITVDEDTYSTTPDTAFRWDSTGQQWIFNQSTKNNGTLNQAGTTYYFGIQLNDGSWIYFQYGLK